MPIRLHALLASLLALLLAPCAAMASHDDRMAANANGEVVVDAYFYDEADPPAAQKLVRLDSALAPVAAFGRNGFLDDPVPADGNRPELELTDDGGVVQVHSSGTPRVTVMRRLQSGGRPDAAFGPGGSRELDLGGDFQVADIRIDGEDRVVIAGAVAPGGAAERGVVARVLPDGSLDPDFGNDGVVEMAAGRGGLDDIELLAGDAIQVAGADYVTRLEAGGELDESFGAAGFQPLDPADKPAVAASGTGLFVATGLGQDGIAVERRLENGSPDPDWGDAGRAVIALDAGGDAFFDVSSVVARPGGGAAVGTGRYENNAGGEGIDSYTGVLALLDAGGELDHTGELAAPVERLERGAGGSYVIFGTSHTDLCDCLPGDASIVVLAAFDDLGEPAAARTLQPRFPAPDVTIDAGPPNSPGAVTGSSAAFTLTATPGFDGDEVVLECSLRGAPYAPCPAGGTFSGLPEGPAELRVIARGVNDARSDEAVYAWTVNYKAPETTVTAAPPATTEATSARIEFTADEPVTFTCSVDSGPTVSCASGVVELSGLSVGAHEVAIRATDRFGASLPEPARVRWTVTEPATTGPPTGQQPQPTPSPTPTPIPTPTPPAGQPKQIQVVNVGKLRRGRVRVRVLPPDTGPLRIRLNARIGGRVRRLGSRVVQGRAGVARTWVVKLSRRGKRTVNRAARRSQPVRIRATVKVATGAARR